MWPDKSTAFLVIHGIGEQKAYETLDSYTRTFWKYLSTNNPRLKIRGIHKVIRQEDFIKSYVALKPEIRKEVINLDFYEYYWAHVQQRQVDLRDIVKWLIDTSKGAKKFYKENEKLVAKYEERKSPAFKNNKFRKKGYLHLIRNFHGFIFFISWLLKSRVLSFFVKHSTFLQWILRKVNRKIIDYVGDIVAYTATDMKSKHFAVRESIIKGSLDQLINIIKDDSYDQILVVGHSLGSVIAYNTLNKLNLLVNVDAKLRKKAKKIKGLITFGSPLDKIAFFFREHTREDAFIRRQIIDFIHGFKARDWNLKKDLIRMESEVKQYLDHIYWVNFWDQNDPISGELDFYKVDQNIQLNQGIKWGKSHSNYWKFTPMYRQIFNYYLKKTKTKFPTKKPITKK